MNNKKSFSSSASSIKRSFEVKQESDLINMLLTEWSDLSRSKIKKYLSNNMILVEGRPTRQFDFPLRKGMTVYLQNYSGNSMKANPYLSIVYEDSWLVIINKQPGVLSMQSDHHGFCVKTLLDQYFHQKHLPCTAHVVHRLDRETSGLMIYAKSSHVQQTLEHHWHDIVTDRRYVAVVRGKMKQKQGTIRSWLKDDKFFFTYSSPIDNGGKLAITHFQTLKVSDRYSLVELQLETGRKNQIRVHMQDLGFPVVGDHKYGGDDEDPIGRLALHAFKLCFTHPVTMELMSFETRYPSPFLQLV